jgi:hypothetical protein
MATLFLLAAGRIERIACADDAPMLLGAGGVSQRRVQAPGSRPEHVPLMNPQRPLRAQGTRGV